jgi:DNA polymerase-3 subunit beta
MPKLIASAVTRVSKAADKRGYIPVLSHIRLTIRSGMATLTATDMGLAITETVAWDAPDCEGLIPADTLTRALKAGATGAITQAESGAWYFAGHTIPSLPIADFPDVTPPATWASSFDLSCDAIRRLIGRIAVCQSSEETRYYLRGVYLNAAHGELRAVATCGHRMGVATMPLPAGAESMPEGSGPHPGVIIPSATIKHILALLPKTGECRVDINHTRIRITCGATVIVSKLIDGTFPPYERVIPARALTETHFINAEMTAAIKTAVAVCSEKQPKVIMTWRATDLVTVEARDGDAGSMCEVACHGSMPATPDAEFRNAANSRYWLQILAELGDMVRMSTPDPATPMRIEDVNDPSILFVLMPIRI